MFSNGRNYTPSQARDYGELLDAIDKEVAESGILALTLGARDDAAHVITDGVEADLDGGDAGSGAMERIVFDELELFAEGVDGDLDLAGVLREDGDFLAAKLDRLVGDGGGDFAIGGGRDGNDVGELEVGLAELGELGDESVDLDAAHAGVFGTELLPGEVEGFVGFGVANPFEAGDPRGGAVVRQGVEGLLAAYPGTDGERGWGWGLIVHNFPFGENRTCMYGFSRTVC